MMIIPDQAHLYITYPTYTFSLLSRGKLLPFPFVSLPFVILE